jgi:hypothetical protein
MQYAKAIAGNLRTADNDSTSQMARTNTNLLRTSNGKPRTMDRTTMSNDEHRDTRPLLNKLPGYENQHAVQRRNQWHKEGQEWSKTGRDFVEMFMNALRALFG